VVLPQPLGPIIETNSLSPTINEISPNASIFSFDEENVLDILVNSINAG
jgi:hypothetical protein